MPDCLHVCPLSSKQSHHHKKAHWYFFSEICVILCILILTVRCSVSPWLNLLSSPRCPSCQTQFSFLTVNGHYCSDWAFSHSRIHPEDSTQMNLCWGDDIPWEHVVQNTQLHGDTATLWAISAVTTVSYQYRFWEDTDGVFAMKYKLKCSCLSFH